MTLGPVMQNIPSMPMPQLPQIPAGGNVGNLNQMGNSDYGQNNPRGFSEQQKIQRSVTRSKKNAGALKATINARLQLEQWLNQYGLKLITSSIDLQITLNFIEASKVIYPDGARIPLPIFLKQTDPSIQQLALEINSRVANIASHLEMIGPDKLNQDDFNIPSY